MKHNKPEFIKTFNGFQTCGSCEICKSLSHKSFYRFNGVGLWFCSSKCKCIWLVNEIKRLIDIWDLVHLEEIYFYLEKLREEIKGR